MARIALTYTPAQIQKLAPTRYTVYKQDRHGQQTMTRKLHVLSEELQRCQKELFYLGAQVRSTPKKLIISTGDISDVDGFFALAEYAKTGADVLFIMNYPNYVQKRIHSKTTNQHIETVASPTDIDENRCADGLGYVYDANTYLPLSEQCIIKKLGADFESNPQFASYTEAKGKYKWSIDANNNMRMALTDLAFNAARRIWTEEKGDSTQFFFGIGGINAVNPFHTDTLKNELFVYAETIGDMINSASYDEGIILSHRNEKVNPRIKEFLNTYSEIYMDFNGSMAFFDTEWADALVDIIEGKRLKGVFVMGGVYSDKEPQTKSSIFRVLNRFSFATMNQLYHPANTAKFFELLQMFKVKVIVVANNQVDVMGNVDMFIRSNNFKSMLLQKMASVYYSSMYNPPRKAFDFYTAIALTTILSGKQLITIPKKLYFDSVYGTTIVGNASSTWALSMQEYSKNIDDTPKAEDNNFMRTAKVNFTKEKKQLKKFACSALDVCVPKFNLNNTTFKLTVEKTERDAVPGSIDFLQSFGPVYNADNPFYTRTEGIEQIPIFFKSALDYDQRENVIGMKALNEWVTKTVKHFTLNFIVIQSLDMFGSRVGFLKFKADVFDKDGAAIPSIVFMRGGSVGILVLIECEGVLYTVLTKQARVPIGNYLYEIPAGMIDDATGDFVGVAAKELREETGIIIKQTELVDLTKKVYTEKYGLEHAGVYPSAGGCDEFLPLYYYHTSMTKEKLDEIQGRLTGESHEGEKIKVEVILLKDLVKFAPDMKALSALALYEAFTKENIINADTSRESVNSSSDWRRLIRA